MRFLRWVSSRGHETAEPSEVEVVHVVERPDGTRERLKAFDYVQTPRRAELSLRELRRLKPVGFWRSEEAPELPHLQ
jgi:hypothetical protein